MASGRASYGRTSIPDGIWEGILHPCVDPTLSHRWDVDTQSAEGLQRALASLVVLSALSSRGPGSPKLAAGVDVAYTVDGQRAWAAAVVMDSALSVVDQSVVEGVPDRPYAPGLLAFREGRLSLEALCALESRPDVIFVDGHGTVHERGFGLASHIGVLLSVPTIGVPKTPFHAIDHAPGSERGSFYVLTKEWGAEGAALRLRTGVKPVYVSPGHLVDLDSAIALCMEWSTGHHKVPEPLQAAHTLSVSSRAAAVARDADSATRG
jgi:deoxyribonuclease V